MSIDEIYNALHTMLDSVPVTAPAGTLYAGTYELGAKGPVFPGFSLRGSEESWGGQLISSLDGQRLHAWFFSQVASDAPDNRNRGGQLHLEWVVTLYGYLEQRTNTHTDHSDLDFNREANAIELALNADPQSMPVVLRSLKPFHLRRNVRLLAGKSVHIAVGDLIVKSC